LKHSLLIVNAKFAPTSTPNASTTDLRCASLGTLNIFNAKSQNIL
jgi:hypothetical protein